MRFWPILGNFWCPVVTLETGCPFVPNLGKDGHVCPSLPILGTDGQISNFFSFFFFSYIFKKQKILPKKRSKKNAIPLVLPNETINLWPELSNPPRLRIQGGSPEPYGGTNGRMEILMSNFGLLFVKSTIILVKRNCYLYLKHNKNHFLFCIEYCQCCFFL